MQTDRIEMFITSRSLAEVIGCAHQSLRALVRSGELTPDGLLVSKKRDVIIFKRSRRDEIAHLVKSAFHGN